LGALFSMQGALLGMVGALFGVCHLALGIGAGLHEARVLRLECCKLLFERMVALLQGLECFQLCRTVTMLGTKERQELCRRARLVHGRLLLPLGLRLVTAHRMA
jgi:hypothetical protein